MIARTREHGRQATTRKLDRALGIEGVGRHAQECVEATALECAFSDGAVGTFTAPVVPNSAIPALLGLKSLRSKRAILDTTGMLYLPGDGGFHIKLSPGSIALKLELTPSGHLLLPCSEYGRIAAEGVDPKLAFQSSYVDEGRQTGMTHCNPTTSPSPSERPARRPSLPRAAADVTGSASSSSIAK